MCSWADSSNFGPLTCEHRLDGARVVTLYQVLTNTTGSPIPLTVLDYTGWDLFDDSANDTAVFVPPNILRQTQGDVTADSIALDPADFFAVHNCNGDSNCEDVFVDENSGGDLNNNAGPVGPYAEYSWQNNVTLPANSSVTINRRLVISSDPRQAVPALPLGALILLMGLMAAAVYHNRRSGLS